jgi:G3E family GTPase
VDKFDRYLRSILWEDELPDNMPHTKFEIHRLKGRIPVSDGRLLLLQGVRNIYDLNEARSSTGEASGDAKLVLIGRGVDQQAFQDSLLATLA